MKNVHVVRADFGRYTQAFETNHYVGIGWFSEHINFQSTREEIKEIYKTVFPDHGNMTMSQNSGQIFRFINDIKIGDIVITPYSNTLLLVGEVKSDAYFKKDSTSVYYIRKNVEWFSEKLDRTTLSIPLQNTLRSSLTVYTLRNSNEILTKYNLAPATEIKQRTEFNLYATIKEKLNELDGFEFEILVSYLLQTIGFEKTEATQGGVGDGGIDFEGVLNVFGVASVNLQVQVKSYENTQIGPKEITSFRGAMKKDFQGCFVTLSDFNKKAIENAGDPKKIPVTLIDGKKLIDIFINQYDDIIAAMREEENDELADKLKFKKALIPY